MAQNGKPANRLVGASCAAVLAVYVAGYARTQSAANRLAAEIADRRSPVARALRAVPATAAATEPGKIATPLAPVVATARLHDAVTPAEPEPEQKLASASNASPAVADPPAALPSVTTAVPPPAAVPAPPAPAPAQWKDGTYTGWGYSRHGNIEASVVIEGGRIASATISQCRTRYSCSVIEQLPPQVAQRQSPEVDYVSGATQSANAFYGAVVEALGKAK